MVRRDYLRILRRIFGFLRLIEYRLKKLEKDKEFFLHFIMGVYITQIAKRLI